MKFKSILFSAALAVAAPLTLAASANAAPMHHDAYHDHGHRPPLRSEHRPPMPHGGHYRWHAGEWRWDHGMWNWAPGIWIRF